MFIGYFIITIGVVLLIASVTFEVLNEKNPYFVAAVLGWTVMIIVYLGYLWRRRSRTPSALAVLNTDHRRPVLYLRPFDQERRIFASLANAEAERLGLSQPSFSDLRSFSTMLLPARNFTLEKYLAKEISTNIGPFIALGNPEDYVPPEGALRITLPDKEWMDGFKNIAQKAACIVIQVGGSESVRWELETIRKQGLQKKVVIVNGPFIPGDRRWTGLLRQLARFYEERIKGMVIGWDGVAAELRALGYRLDFRSPGRGTIVDFDDNAEATILASGARIPSDYSSAMKSLYDNE